MNNAMREKLERGEKTLGVFLELGSATVAECLGLGGLDYLIIDTEHGPFDPLAALDFREIGSVNLGEVGQLFLGEFFALPQGFNSCSKSLVNVHSCRVFSNLQSYCHVDSCTTGYCLQRKKR